MSTLRVLPADVYDALELSSIANNGIGYGVVGWSDSPQCILGHAAFLDTGRSDGCGAMHDLWGTVTKSLVRTLGDFPGVVATFAPVSGAWTPWGRVGQASDWAVNRIAERRGVDYATLRVTFKAWCKELNVVRGER